MSIDKFKGIAKEGCFNYARRQAEDGRKIRRKSWDEDDYIVIDNHFIKDERGELYSLALEDLDAEDWEVVSDTDNWNLAKQMAYCFELTGVGDWNKSWAKAKIKKCRDLITSDLKANNSFAKVVRILNKRFGDLK